MASMYVNILLHYNHFQHCLCFSWNFTRLPSGRYSTQEGGYNLVSTLIEVINFFHCIIYAVVEYYFYVYDIFHKHYCKCNVKMMRQLLPSSIVESFSSGLWLFTDSLVITCRFYIWTIVVAHIIRHKAKQKFLKTWQIIGKKSPLCCSV